MKSKKICSVAMALFMFAQAHVISGITDKTTINNSLLSVTANAQEELFTDNTKMNAENIHTGICGDNAEYVLDDQSGVLTIRPVDTTLGYGIIENKVYDNSDGIHINDLGDIQNYFGDIYAVVIEEGITEIKEWALGCLVCTKSLLLPDSLKKMGALNIGEMRYLESLHIPANLTEIRLGSDFNMMTGLNEITVDPANPVYDSRDNCKALIKTDTNTLIIGGNNSFVPETVEHIGPQAFANSYYLKNLILPEGLKTIGWQAFGACFRLKNVFIPSTVTEIEEGAFADCFSLENVTLSEGIKTIGDYAFGDTLGIKEITIPSSVEHLGEGCFADTTCKDYTILAKDIDITDSGIGCSHYFPETTDYVFDILPDIYIHWFDESELDEDHDPECALCAEYEDINKYISEHCENYDEEGNEVYTPVPGVKITGYCKSSAKTYAEANGMYFEVIHSNIQQNEKGYKPTCTQPGFTGGSACLDCETVIDIPEYIPPKGHTVVADAEISATCTVSGLTEGTHCSVCSAVITAQEVIYPQGHTDNDNDGICDSCGEQAADDTLTITLGERIRRFFVSIFDKIFNIFKRFFSK